MNIVCGDLKFVEIYLDDLTVHSSSVELHIEHLMIVFERLKGASLSLNPEKCVFLAEKIKILGYIVSQHEVTMDPEKIEPIKSRLPPRNVKEVQQFLGIASYYRRFKL